MADQSITALQIRIPAALDAELNRMSSEAGISKNAMMLVLMQLGKRLYSAEVRIVSECGTPLGAALTT